MSAGNSNIFRDILKMMYNKNPNCYYCKKRTKLKSKSIVICSSDTATIEHLYDKRDIRRFITGNYKGLVLACYRCNKNTNSDRDMKFRQYIKDCPEINIINLLNNQNELPNSVHYHLHYQHTPLLLNDAPR